MSQRRLEAGNCSFKIWFKIMVIFFKNENNSLKLSWDRKQQQQQKQPNGSFPGWSDGSATESIDYSFRGLRFDSQHLRGCLQSLITAVPGDLMHTSDLSGQANPPTHQRNKYLKINFPHPLDWMTGGFCYDGGQSWTLIYGPFVKESVL